MSESAENRYQVLVLDIGGPQKTQYVFDRMGVTETGIIVGTIRGRLATVDNGKVKSDAFLEREDYVLGEPVGWCFMRVQDFHIYAFSTAQFSKDRITWVKGSLVGVVYSQSAPGPLWVCRDEQGKQRKYQHCIVEDADNETRRKQWEQEETVLERRLFYQQVADLFNASSPREVKGVNDFDSAVAMVRDNVRTPDDVSRFSLFFAWLRRRCGL